MSIILFLCAAIMLICLYFQTVDSFRFRRGILLSVSLPSCAESDHDIISAVKELKKELKKLTLIGFLLYFPIFLFTKYVSITIAYMVLWFSALLFVYHRFIKSANLRLIKLKAQKNWVSEYAQKRRVDLNCISDKKKSAVSRLWFLPAAAMTALNALMYFFLKSKEFAPITAVTSSLCLVTMYICYLYTLRVPTKVYSEDSEKNREINRIYLRSWSALWVFEANIQSAVYLLGVFFAEHILIILAVSSILMIGAIVFTVSTVKNAQNALADKDSEYIYCDSDDMCWINGDYRNPNDSRFIVEKRLGIGFTFNMATKKGKLFTGAILSFVAVIIAVMLIMFFKLDFGSLNVNISGDTINIDAPMYDTSFSADEIKSVYTLNELPNGIRTNGAAAGSYKLGHFRFDGLGNCLLYVYSDSNPYIVVELENKNIVIALKNSEENEKLLEYLKNLG